MHISLPTFKSLLAVSSSLFAISSAFPGSVSANEDSAELSKRQLGTNDVFILATCVTDTQNRFGFNYSIHLNEINYYADRSTVGNNRKGDHSTVIEIANDYTEWWDAPVHPFRGVRWTGVFNQGGPTSHGFFSVALEGFESRYKDNIVGVGWYIDGGADDWVKFSSYKAFYFCYKDDRRELYSESFPNGKTTCKKDAYCIRASG